MKGRPPVTPDIQEAEDIGASVGLEDENNLFVWNVIFEGPTDTLYEVRSTDDREVSSRQP